MHLILESTLKHCDGVIDVSLTVVHEPRSFYRYTYQLQSEDIVHRFEKYYRQGRGMHRTALALLNKHKLNS